MATLLDNDEILATNVSYFDSIVTHSFGHLLHLKVVVVLCALTAFVGISDLGQTSFKHGFCFLHLALSL